ncbi:hypothetical protein [Pseudazoarcus pumilus]|uniref:Lipoprotein n=1 Tax=Pseudazoarcus pumilus TaxID=2067960 RepID=A0A2I6S8G2_9RHOO|nr:hypothetical protein [Pseudazoarcus pumilus]AUN95545.1 hypothetical protein C0099_11755 [Pseudazoarcus pumilus]
MRALLCLAIFLLAACAPTSQQRHAQGGSDMFAVPAAETASAEEGSRDVLVPGWRVGVTQIDETRYRLELRMRTLITGGAGEARQAFLHGARQLVEDGGHAGFDVLRYEEGIDSGLFFGRRSARGEIRVVRSQMLGY